MHTKADQEKTVNQPDMISIDHQRRKMLRSALTLAKTDESTTTGSKDIAPLILSTRSWVSVGLEVSVVISQSLAHIQRGKLG